MDGFEFENCGNAVLKCEGKILGGGEKELLHGNQGIFQ